MSTFDYSLAALKFAAILGCALIAGTFFAFSAFVMSALSRLAPPQGIAAMQSINITVINPWFMGVFMGTTLACLALGASSIVKWHSPGSLWLLVGSLLYVIGTFGVTAAFNVPLNDALTTVKPDSPEAARLWATYLSTWTMWNHVRTFAAVLALVSFLVSLNQRTGN